MSLVTIVTPSFNQANYLDACLQTVLRQDYPQIEYIVVDGGSTDGSPEIIQHYAARLAWWVSEPDAGQAEAINKGFARAQGEYVAWLNSDDLYLPGAVSQAVAVLQANPEIGFVFGNAISIDATGKPLNPMEFADWGLADLMAFRIICQPAVFMRRSILEQAGFLDTNYHFMLDHQLWLRMARLAPIRHLPLTLAAARYHAQAKNVSQPAGFGQEALRVLGWMISHPDFAPLVRQNQRKIQAGAYRLNARYLLDGGQPAPALCAYGKAFVGDPLYTLKHGHRIAYAAASLLGLGSLADRFAAQRTGHPPSLTLAGNPGDWPGLSLESLE